MSPNNSTSIFGTTKIDPLPWLHVVHCLGGYFLNKDPGVMRICLDITLSFVAEGLEMVWVGVGVCVGG